MYFSTLIYFPDDINTHRKDNVLVYPNLSTVMVVPRLISKCIYNSPGLVCHFKVKTCRKSNSDFQSYHCAVGDNIGGKTTYLCVLWLSSAIIYDIKWQFFYSKVLHCFNPLGLSVRVLAYIQPHLAVASGSTRVDRQVLSV